MRSVGGVTVSMVAFQAVDPGSTPGRRTFFISYFELQLCWTLRITLAPRMPVTAMRVACPFVGDSFKKKGSQGSSNVMVAWPSGLRRWF